MKFLIALLLLALLLQTVSAQCSQIYTRREVRKLSAAQRLALVSAINTINNRPNSNTPSLYDNFVNIHIQYQWNIHNNADFFPFHRKFTREFEKLLQSVNPTVTIPYWDWTLDASNPARSPVWGSDILGGQGDLNDLCRTKTGPFAYKTCFYASNNLGKHYLRRCWTGPGSLWSFSSYPVVQNIITNSANFATFRSQFESNPHSIPHLAIGGSANNGALVGDMSPMMSPNDPAFWLHHSFVDKVWSDFQNYRASNFWSYGGTRAGGATATLNDIMPYYTSTRTGDVFNITKLCYRYESNSADHGVAAQALAANVATITKKRDVSTVNVANISDEDLQALYPVQKSPPVPLTYLQAHGFNVSVVRYYESVNNQVVDTYNAKVQAIKSAALTDCALAKQLLVGS